MTAGQFMFTCEQFMCVAQFMTEGQFMRFIAIHATQLQFITKKPTLCVGFCFNKTIVPF